MIEMIDDALGNHDLLSAQSSKAMEREVSIDVFEAVMPIQNDVAFVHTLNTKSNELGYAIELSLACWNVSWINIHAFKMCEENFTWICIIRMRSKNHERKLKFGSNGFEFL